MGGRGGGVSNTLPTTIFQHYDGSGRENNLLFQNLLVKMKLVQKWLAEKIGFKSIWLKTIGGPKILNWKCNKTTRDTELFLNLKIGFSFIMSYYFAPFWIWNIEIWKVFHNDILPHLDLQTLPELPQILGLSFGSRHLFMHFHKSYSGNVSDSPKFSF